MSLGKTRDSVLLERWANLVLKGQSQARFSILQVDKAFSRGSTSLGESSLCLVGHKVIWICSSLVGFSVSFCRWKAWTIQDSCSPNTWLHPWTSPGHSEPIIKNLAYKRGSYLNRHTYTSSASSALFPPSSSATQPHSSSSSFITGCWSDPIPCPTIVGHSNCVVLRLYILASLWFMLHLWAINMLEKVKSFLFIHPFQDRWTGKKSLMEIFDILWQPVQSFCMLRHIQRATAWLFSRDLF